MNQSDIKHEREPIRLFHSGFLEYFTHVNPVLVPLLYIPAISYLLYRGAAYTGDYRWGVLVLFWITGLAVWSPVEYLLHRFFFHFKPRGQRQERISFLFHGVHHAQPMVKTRLVMPPMVSIPLAVLFYFLFRLTVTLVILLIDRTGGSMIPGIDGSIHAAWPVYPLFAGFLSGYVLYDMLHYSMHHFNIKSGYIRKIRRHHMRHHSLTPDKRFGVTSDIWDRVFGTHVAD